MNRAKFSAIAHRDHIFANPLGEGKLHRVLGLMNLTSGSSVLDIGCGNAEILIRLIEQYGIRGVGVDPSPHAVAEANRRLQGRIPTDRLELHQLPAGEFNVPDNSFDGALCIGASHAYGDYLRTLQALKGLVRSGGHILIGEGYWKRDPDPDYLALLGAEPDEMTDHASNVFRAAELGLTPLYSVTGDNDDWDHYEGLYCRGVELYVAENPEDPECPEFRDYIRQWYAGYLRWGRETLGFGLYLFRV